ncbi:MAG TPA: hypothetical protein ENH35_02900 [Candidatus Moranbacteria bacterium]|nr:hypothetical protein [Candidatus Pacearchaeota archaeon]HDZ85466.1 hypothetical protein [Candidatus Moranbacteria bacterium]
MKYILTYIFNSRPNKNIRVEANSTQVAGKKIDPLAYKIFTPVELKSLIKVELREEGKEEDQLGF